MTEAPGGSAGFGHGSDPEEHEALLRRIREFLRHGAAAEAGVEEWGEFAAQLRFLREELPLEERTALLERWDRVLMRALPDLQLPTDQRENLLLALEAAAAEGAAWAALEDRAPPEQPSGVAPVLRPSVWTLDWESAGGGEEEAEHREDERSEEHTSELQSHSELVCRLPLEKKNNRGERWGTGHIKIASTRYLLKLRPELADV